MISYDPAKISVEIVYLKSITTALGGSISVLDLEQSSEKKEVMHRMDCPLSVARAFIQKHKKVTKYLIPVLTAIVKYEDRIICLERHPLGTFAELETEGFDGTMQRWTPDCELNIDRYINPLIFKQNREWFFDGRYIYSFNSLDMQQVIDTAAAISDDGKFKKLICVSLDTQELANADKIEPTERTCLAFVANTGEYSVSPPIWKDLTSVGNTKIDNEDDAGIMRFSFDNIDEQMSVNLNFALAAGKQIGSTFGYDYIEPLQLPRMMIDLHTVNLPNVPKQVKATYDIGIKFTHTMAWLLGLLSKADNLDTYIIMRSLMKYLTQKGIFRNSSFKAKNVFVEQQSIKNVQMKSLDALLEDTEYTRLNLAHIIEQARVSGSRRTRQSGTSLGGLVTEN